MAKKEDRFVRTYGQGVLDTVEIFVDRETGVNYLFRSCRQRRRADAPAGPEGRPVITTVFEEEE